MMASLSQKPSIISVISQRVKLRKAGKEWTGLCPFHADKAPSFSVNEGKGLFHCFGCGAKGDVIDFIRQLDGIEFREARARLGMDTSFLPMDTPERRAAERAASWLNEQRDKVGALLLETDEQLHLADKIQDDELGEVFWREQAFLRDLHEDLQQPQYVTDFLALRESLKFITAGVAPLPPPRLSSEERQQLREALLEVLP
jgi:hypothetical protein